MISGELSFLAGRKWQTAGPGETVVVPAGTRHAYRNSGTEPAHASATRALPRRLEEFLDRRRGDGPRRQDHPPRAAEVPGSSRAGAAHGGAPSQDGRDASPVTRPASGISSNRRGSFVITPSTPSASSALDPLGVVDRPDVDLAARRVHRAAPAPAHQQPVRHHRLAAAGAHARGRLAGQPGAPHARDRVGGQRERRARVVAPHARHRPAAPQPRGELAEAVEALGVHRGHERALAPARARRAPRPPRARSRAASCPRPARRPRTPRRRSGRAPRRA